MTSMMFVDVMKSELVEDTKGGSRSRSKNRLAQFCDGTEDFGVMHAENRSLLRFLGGKESFD
ncbi:predicted protein [Sclerotinia sclerotiorum 1980 UF-70]|uniref:Uncharacterized protein n=1 Tax=Sclerotinia sclerotiorum (strain ATCC 18683 / 1980 / Ss-1) TaxID=665079 RepID=A7EA18_SCLS1|nr:predicted protein [Sclerotinia sclerotiorum 1980 UF-70]EDN99296.1 predicted protein [Sclerotinia sclerotiorum 1980 UF-70]